MNQAGLQKMRIIAIPLTRPRPNVTGAGLQRLTYYQFQVSGKGKQKSAPGKEKGWLPEEGVVNWVTNKAADIWAGFGKAKGGWKLKTFQFGEKLVDKMEFEELALKSFDPSMGPSIAHLRRGPVLDEKAHRTIPLFYPPSEMSPSVVLSELEAYTRHRIPRHRKGFFLWMFIAPLTTPFILIPIIPNLPFFFCVWRSWSHYRAYRSSQYLQSLLEHNLIEPEASKSLDKVYKNEKYQPPTRPELSRGKESFDPSNKVPPEPKQALLLNREAVPAILSLFELKPDSPAAAELYRAVEQARLRVSTAQV